MTRESILIPVDVDLLRQLDALALASGSTRHDLARVAIGLGIEIMRQPRGAGRR
jgi:predicted transcriptional regulator